MTKNQQAQLAKTVQVFEGTKEGSQERAQALEALKGLCEKHAIRLSDFVDDAKGKDWDFDFRSEEAKAQPVKRQRADGKPSRRGMILDFIDEGKWTRAQMADKLEKDGYGSLGDCKKAVSGTIYDRRKNAGIDIRENEKGIVYIHTETK